MSRHFGTLMVLAAVAALPAADAPHLSSCRTQTGAASLDWSSGMIQVTGRAPLGNSPTEQVLARRTAELDGYRNILEVAQGVTVTADRSVGEMAAEDQTIQLKLDGFVKGATVVDERVEQGPPRELVLTMVAPLHGQGGLGDIVVDQLREKPGVGPLHKSDLTGVVIDARAPQDHQGEWPLLVPALFPTVTDPNGKVLYDARSLTRDAAARTGAAVYYDVSPSEGTTNPPVGAVDLSAARARIGSRPACLRGWPVAGRDSTVYLSDSDAAILRRLAGSDVLREGRVILLRSNVTPPAAKTAEPAASAAAPTAGPAAEPAASAAEPTAEPAAGAAGPAAEPAKEPAAAAN